MATGTAGHGPFKATVYWACARQHRHPMHRTDVKPTRWAAKKKLTIGSVWMASFNQSGLFNASR